MKTRVLSITAVALLFASAAAAQTKISGKQNCPKPEVIGTTDPGDKPGHTLQLVKAACTWTTPIEMAGAKSKDGTSYAFSEITATRLINNGTYVAEMDNGDKFYVTFHESAMMKDGMPQGDKGTWSFTGGTGKLKGITGKGTHTVTLNPDGTSTVSVEGDYSIAAAAPKKTTMSKNPS
ncbi:MAG TPA: hypothetical protein VIH76_16440 [Candidatus Acidoferrales bacterium]